MKNPFRFLFRRKRLDNIRCSVLGHELIPSSAAQYYCFTYEPGAEQSAMAPATTNDWNLKVEFEEPDRVIITVRDSVILSSRRGIGLDVTGSLLLKQAKPDCALIVSGNTCGIQTTGTLTIAIDEISVSASGGPAMQSGGNVTAYNFLYASLCGAKPLCCDGDINMTARAVPTASIAVNGGICSRGNVVLRTHPTVCPSKA